MTARGDERTTCSQTYEPKPPDWGRSDKSWRSRTHTCKLGAGHEPPHVCPRCGSSWSPASVHSDDAARDDTSDSTQKAAPRQ
jgi:hypothetical protein